MWFSDADVDAQDWRGVVAAIIGVLAPGGILDAVAFDVQTANGGFVLSLGLCDRGSDLGRAGRVCG